jgi:hypothetical protein
MKDMRRVILSFLLGCSQGPAPTGPTESTLPRHSYSDPQPIWRQQVSYMRYQPGTFVVVPAAEVGVATDLYKQIEYFEGAASRPIKRVVLFPGGQRELEQDMPATGELFERTFYRDGSLASELECKLVGARESCASGRSEDPTHTQHSSFDAGRGPFQRWSSFTDSSTIDYYWDGASYLEIVHDRAGKIVGGQLLAPDGSSMMWNSEREQLMLHSTQEAWTRPAAGAVYGNATSSPALSTDGDAIHHLLLDAFDRDDPEVRERRLAAGYATRRAGFLRSYQAVLGTAGQTWDSVGLGDLPDAR